jgi:hypothetical protein
MARHRRISGAVATRSDGHQRPCRGRRARGWCACRYGRCADNPPDGTKVEADTPAYAVGRDNLHCPAPGLRVAQTLGDQFFNDDTPINEALNGSPLGTGYHVVYGTRGNLEFEDTDGDGEPDTYMYEVGTGEEACIRVC